ncbi:hypothetical protein [Peribacillus sp. SI8-4]|uniref:hypothetical protein n=1 Tax=Peribacillus sp. SI8-4 TaxID=3048009 RepID=UPI002554D713|nr:hypothetical protein [Peribacillus sp. SI8-4]
MTNKKIIFLISIPVGLFILVVGTLYVYKQISQGEFSTLPDGINISVYNASQDTIPESKLYLVNGDGERVVLSEFPELKESNTFSFNTKFIPDQDYNLAISYEINGKNYEEIIMYAGANSTKLGAKVTIHSIDEKNKVKFSLKTYDGFQVIEEE